MAASFLSAAEPPAWWAEQTVLTPGVAPDDYAVANLGQLKFIASKAAAAMDAEFALAGGAGTEITQKIATWAHNPDNYAAANIGQAKYIASLFYSRLTDLDYSGPPLQAGQTIPWTGASDDHALVNLGQLKYLFSFNIVNTLFHGPDDDSDGMSDAWELHYFGTLSRNGTLDFDGDGIIDLFEFQGGGNPILVPNTTTSERFNLTYDSLGRLDATTAPAPMSFSFDDEGSLLSVQ